METPRQDNLQTAYVGLGSNLEQPCKQLDQALSALRQISRSRLREWSNYYLTEPIGPADQPDYVNAVATLDTGLTPLDLLHELQIIEQQHGRLRDPHNRWGPRTLDLDILLFGSVVSPDPLLTLPHPRLHERLFALIPLQELAPGITIPGVGLIADAISKAPQLTLHVLPDRSSDLSEDP